MNAMPESLRGYQRAWLVRDVIAGLTLAAVAIPEVMGYTSIAETPIVTGVYTIIFPTLVFALLGSSRLLVVGADSATAAILAAGLAGLGVSGLTPYSQEWLDWCSLVALICGVLLILARLLKLGFIGNFLSASVLIGFLSGVGISVLTGQLPRHARRPQVQRHLATTAVGHDHLDPRRQRRDRRLRARHRRADRRLQTLPAVRPGAVVAVILSIVISTATDAKQHGVAVIGSLQGLYPLVGLPGGFTWSDVASATTIAVGCFVLILAQSAATSSPASPPSAAAAAVGGSAGDVSALRQSWTRACRDRLGDRYGNRSSARGGSPCHHLSAGASDARERRLCPHEKQAGRASTASRRGTARTAHGPHLRGGWTARHAGERWAGLGQDNVGCRVGCGSLIGGAGGLAVPGFLRQ